MTIYLVRHGQTDWNVRKKIQGNTDIPLNETGEQQAKELADQLVDKTKAGTFHVEKVYTSAQMRAAKTARIVAEALEIPCEEMSGLEEMSLGAWEGLKWQDVEEAYGEVYQRWNAQRRYYRIPEGECYNDVLERTLVALRKIMEAEKDKDVLVVTHSAIIMALRSYLMSQPFDEDIMLSYATKNAEVIGIDSEDIWQAIRRFENGK